jgi:hypothetical protein
MEQRFLELDILSVTSTEVTVDAPPSTCYATPGPYMLFALSDDDVPSIGEYVYVTGECDAAEDPADPPPTPSTLTVTNGLEIDGLQAFCGSATSQLSLATFGRTVNELCQVFGACPANETVELEARLIASDTQSVPGGGTVLDTGEV